MNDPKLEFGNMLSKSVITSIQKKVDSGRSDFDETMLWAFRVGNDNNEVRNVRNKFDEEMQRAIAREILKQAYGQGQMSSVQQNEYMLGKLKGYW